MKFTAAWTDCHVTWKYLLSESLNVFAAHLLFLSACLSLLISVSVCVPPSWLRLVSVLPCWGHSLKLFLIPFANYLPVWYVSTSISVSKMTENYVGNSNKQNISQLEQEDTIVAFQHLNKQVDWFLFFLLVLHVISKLWLFIFFNHFTIFTHRRKREIMRNSESYLLSKRDTSNS